MKRIIRYTALALMVLVSVSCAKSALEKAEVEAGFDPKAALPTIQIGSDITAKPFEGIADVIVTVAGATGQEGVEIGVISGTASDFSSSSYVAIEATSDGTYTVPAKVVANTTNYFKACVKTTSGCAYSSTQSMDIPDIPMGYKIDGTYTAKDVADNWGDTYNFNFKIVKDEADPEHYCYVENFCPYVAENFGSYRLKAEVDEENGCIHILPLQQLAGIYDFLFVAMNASQVTSPCTLLFNSALDKCVTENIFGINSNMAGGWMELFRGDKAPIVFTRK